MYNSEQLPSSKSIFVLLGSLRILIQRYHILMTWGAVLRQPRNKFNFRSYQPTLGSLYFLDLQRIEYLFFADGPPSQLACTWFCGSRFPRR